MAKPNKASNPIMKAKELAKEAKNRNAKELIPPSLGSGGVQGGRSDLKTFTGIAKEQERLYELVFAGKLHISDFTKLMYGLGQISAVLKSKAELDALEDAYSKQWQGVRIIAPEGVEVPQDPHETVIEGEIIDV